MKNIIEFHDGEEIIVSASKAEFDGQLSEGVIKAANILLDKTVKISAEEISFKNGEISEAKGVARITSCEECEGKEPDWYLSASSAKRDSENFNIVYKDVTVRVKAYPLPTFPI